MPVMFRRHNTVKIDRNPGMEIHVSLMIVFPDDPDERQYLEIREWNTVAELYGHGILLPLGLTPNLQTAVNEVVGAL